MNYDWGLFMISINKLNYLENKSLISKTIMINKCSLSIPFANRYEKYEIKNDLFEISKFKTKSFI